MEYRLDFLQLAQEFGGTIEEVQLPNGAVSLETKWNPESGRRFLKYINEKAQELPPDTQVIFNGHTDPWVMLGILDRMRHFQLGTYLSVFDCVVPLDAYRIGDRPTEGQPVLFEISEADDNVFLTLKAGTPRLPMEMPLSEMRCPQIPDGRNIFLKLADAKVLNLLGMALTLGKTCKTMYVEQETNRFRCAISHVDGIMPGDDAAM